MPRATDSAHRSAVAVGSGRHQYGISLVEIMISIVLGLLITASVTGIFLSGSRNYQQDDRFARMQENGRYTLNLLADELSSAGYWGRLSNLGSITSTLSDSCGITLSAVDPIGIVNNAAAADATPLCIAADSFRVGTDILVVKRVLGDPVATPEDGKVYLRAGSSTGNFIESDGTAAGTGQTDWEFVPRIYYLRNTADPDNAANTIPVLARKYLSGTSMNFDETLVDGIENIHIEFGINTGTGANIGLSPNYYDADPSATELKSAVTARIYVLVRSRDPDGAYTNTKTYQLGGLSIDPVDDNYYRRVFSTTVSLRNPAYLHRLN